MRKWLVTWLGVACGIILGLTAKQCAAEQWTGWEEQGVHDFTATVSQVYACEACRSEWRLCSLEDGGEGQECLTIALRHGWVWVKTEEWDFLRMQQVMPGTPVTVRLETWDMDKVRVTVRAVGVVTPEVRETVYQFAFTSSWLSPLMTARVRTWVFLNRKTRVLDFWDVHGFSNRATLVHGERGGVFLRGDHKAFTTEQ